MKPQKLFFIVLPLTLITAGFKSHPPLHGAADKVVAELLLAEGANKDQPNKAERKSEQNNQARKPAGQDRRSEDKVELAVTQVFAGGRPTTCVRENPNITKEEFEQELAKLYKTAPLVKELIDNLDNVPEYIQSKSDYEKVAPFLSYRQIPFSIEDQEYSLILSPRDALSLLRGFVSGDCTHLFSRFERYAPAHLLAPGFLNFRVIRNSDNYWIGNVYTVVANTKNGEVLIIDALQLPWQGGTRHHIKTFPIESLQDSKRISQAAIIALAGDYAAQVNLQEVWLAFTSNFDQLVDYYQDVIYADCPSKSLDQAKEHFRLIGIEDSTSIESFTKMMPTRADKLPRRFIRIWPLEETRSNRLHVAARMADIAKLNGLIEEGAKVDGIDASGNTALHYAARSGLKNVVKFLISTNANVNASGEEGKSPLHHAVEHTHQRAAQLLISEGADVNAKDAAGDTPLHYAAGSESVNKDIIKLLIGAGADVNAKDTAGNTPMHFIAKSRSPGTGIIELLVAKGVNIDAKNKDAHTPLDFAVTRKQRDIAELLVSRGAEISTIHSAAYLGNLDEVEKFVDTGTNIDAEDQEGQTVVDMAVSGGNADVVRFLVDKGVDVNQAGESGWTPLHRAASEGRKNVTKVLIAAGANVNAKDKWGYTALHRAILSYHKDTIKLLVNKGADVNLIPEKDYPPLYYAIWFEDMDMVKLLVNKGADVNLKPEKDYPPLHYAVWSKDMDMVKLLVANGARFDAKDQDGWTAFRYAVTQGSRDLVELFIAKGADVNAKDEDGNTLLHSAASGGNWAVVELLVAKGAAVNVKGKNDRTPLDEATRHGHQDIVELLRKHGAKE